MPHAFKPARPYVAQEILEEVKQVGQRMLAAEPWVGRSGGGWIGFVLELR